MNTLCIVSPHPPWVKGGVERVVGQIAIRLIKRWNVKILSKSNKDKKVNWYGIPVRLCKGSIAIPELKMISLVRREAEKADIVHVHTASTSIPLEVYLGVRETNLVFSPHFHPVASSKFYVPIKKIHDRFIIKPFLKKARIIICVSETEKRFFQKYFDIREEKIRVIPNGVDIKKIRSYKPFKKEGKVLLYIGRFTKYKNIQEIVKAMKFIDPSIKLYLIGGGDYEKALKKIIREEGEEDRVNIVGTVSDDNLYRWINTADLLINLSSIEAFGITVLEGLAAGKKVIVNNKMGLKELASIFKDVEPVDVENCKSEDLANFIEKVLTKKFIEDKKLLEYDWENVAKQYTRVYEEILNEFGGR